MTRRILLIEDDLHVQGLAVAALQAAGFEVEAVATGAEAAASFKRGLPDLVILDVGLPDCSGLELCGG